MPESTTSAAPRNTEEQLVRLAPAVESAMSRCRADFGRQMDAFDFCELCPLLVHCHAQEHEPNKQIAEWWARG